MDNLEKAKCYEALALLTGDFKLAWQCMKEVGIDGSTSLPFYTNAIYTAIGKKGDEIGSAYRFVSDAFDNERIEYSIIDEGSDLFPLNKGDEHVPFIYAAGNKDILRNKRVTCIGSPMPSLQGKNDMAIAVSAFVANGYSIIAPLDAGLGAYALSWCIKEGGNAIGVLSSSLSKCPSQNLLELMGALYERGLLITQFAPSVKSQKWHVVLRNRFIAGISDRIFLAEDKDGGPSWAIFDYAKELGARTMVAKAVSENPNNRWPKDRIASGSLVGKTPSDFKRFAPSSKRVTKRDLIDDLIPDLFS